MKVAILAGGYGTRLSEETDVRPKPMVEIGGKPILWHIMKIYSQYGFNEFVILLGYKGIYIKEFFNNYFLHQSDITIDLKNNHRTVHSNVSEPWKVTLVDTGLETQTGGRLLRAKKYLEDGPFLMTYGDGVGDINIPELINFHNQKKPVLTLTAVLPEGRFGALEIQNNMVSNFIEKPQGDGSWINGGYFVCEPQIFDFIKQGDADVFETGAMKLLSTKKSLQAYRHNGFWRPMDTLRDKHQLESLWKSGKAPWKVWNE